MESHTLDARKRSADLRPCVRPMLHGVLVVSDLLVPVRLRDREVWPDPADSKTVHGGTRVDYKVWKAKQVCQPR